jgi:hypothetical protein
MEVLDVSGGDRLGERWMQHVGLSSSTTTLHPMPTLAPPDRSFGAVGVRALVVQSERELACRGF